MKKIISAEFLQFAKEGQKIRRFYLPVKKNHANMTVECWLFFLAPFVLLFYIIKNIFLSIWRDLYNFTEDLIRWNK